MYGLPKDFNAAIFVGRNLVMICFNENQIYLYFDQKLSIVVEYALSYQDQSTSTPRTIEVPVLKSDLMQLLGHSITNASGNDEGTLTMEFDNGHVLQCLDQYGYEAYQIKIDNKSIIV
jgi:Family of unknown function (DUF6188)